MSIGPILQLDNGHVSVRIAVRGAELKSLRHRGRELIWKGDPAWWDYSAPLLFPVIGRLHDGRIRHEGNVLALPPHGFARELPFTVVRATSVGTELRLRASPETLAIYPFDFELNVSFKLSGRELAQHVCIVNRGTTPMPASFGFHPGFCWPVRKPDRAAHSIHFTDPESISAFGIDATGRLVNRARLLEIHERRLALDDSLFSDGAIVLNPVRSNGLAYWDQGGPLLSLRWAGCGQLGLWTLPGAPFVCIEPWHGHPSPMGFSGSLLEKPGGFVLQPGHMKRFALAIAV